MGILSSIGRIISFLIGLGLLALGIITMPFGLVAVLVSLIFFYLAFRRGRKKAFPFQQQQQLAAFKYYQRA
jgi:membrane protease YdiL (CAAX protease family)